MTQAAKAGRILGSLKDALNAASRDDTQRKAAATSADAAANVTRAETAVVKQPAAAPADPTRKDAPATPAGAGLSATEAAREVKGQTSLKQADKH
ncbi:MAG: hypothetical protein ACXWJV_09890, partial [Hyphomicrobium sp.]